MCCLFHALKFVPDNGGRDSGLKLALEPCQRSVRWIAATLPYKIQPPLKIHIRILSQDYNWEVEETPEPKRSSFDELIEAFKQNPESIRMIVNGEEVKIEDVISERRNRVRGSFADFASSWHKQAPNPFMRSFSDHILAASESSFVSSSGLSRIAKEIADEVAKSENAAAHENLAALTELTQLKTQPTAESIKAMIDKACDELFFKQLIFFSWQKQSLELLAKKMDVELPDFEKLAQKIEDIRKLVDDFGDLEPPTDLES